MVFKNNENQIDFRVKNPHRNVFPKRHFALNPTGRAYSALQSF